jgi:hypothetical protein
MRRALFVAVSAFLFPLSSFAQVPSIVESSILQAGPHSWKLVLRNQSTSSLVAYMVGCKPKRGMTALQDALLNVGHYVGPGEYIESAVNRPSTCDEGVRAAIFSDGHAEGDPEFVEELFAERRGAYQALGDTIKLLASVYTQHVPIADVIDKLEVDRKVTLQKMTHESGGYNSVLIDVSQILTQPRVEYGFPPDNLGQKQQQPPIEDVMNEKGLSRDEARVVILNKRLEVWRALLQNHLQPSQ